MTLNRNNCLFLIIDIQEKLLNAVFNKEIVSKKSEILTKAFNILEIPTIITEQYPKGLGNTVESINLNLNNPKNYFEKCSFNALAEENILNEICKHEKKQIIVIGIETHICVYQTVIDLINKGFEVTVIKDACGSREECEYLSALDIMKEMGAKIKTSEMVIFELLKSSKHPRFKEIQSLIK